MAWEPCVTNVWIECGTKRKYDSLVSLRSKVICSWISLCYIKAGTMVEVARTVCMRVWYRNGWTSWYGGTSMNANPTSQRVSWGRFEYTNRVPRCVRHFVRYCRTSNHPIMMTNIYHLSHLSYLHLSLVIVFTLCRLIYLTFAPQHHQQNVPSMKSLTLAALTNPNPNPLPHTSRRTHTSR